MIKYYIKLLLVFTLIFSPLLQAEGWFEKRKNQRNYEKLSYIGETRIGKTNFDIYCENGVQHLHKASDVHQSAVVLVRFGPDGKPMLCNNWSRNNQH